MLKLKPPLTTGDDDFDAILDRYEELIAFVDSAVREGSGDS